jgi:tRNA(Arg) A34 adenosine deaminase TadA
MHERFMREALGLAEEAGRSGEVPVGAVVVVDGEIVGRGFNRPISSHDPTAHAEIVAIRDAAEALGNYRLNGGTLYVTVEPCLMCVGAIVHARLAMLVFGTAEPKAGAIESTQRAHEHPALNHRFTVVSAVLAAECRSLMRKFFEERREGNLNSKRRTKN